MMKCDERNQPSKPFEFEEFTCPSPGITGTVIKIEKKHGHHFTGIEVQPYGKGPFRYYVSKESGCVGCVKCLFLLTKWVGGS